MRLLFAFVLALTFQAGDTPPPPPFDPAQIFVDGITPEHINHNPYEGVCRNFSVHADPDTRTLHVCDAPGSQWQPFPFPDGMDDFKCNERRSDGTWHLFDLCTSSHFYHNGLEGDWIFDPLTGTYSQPEIICGDTLRALPGEGRWIYTNDDTALCFTEDGRIHELPPQEFEWGTATTSPDKQYVVVIESGIAPDGENIFRTQALGVYSYHLESGMLTSLGELEVHRLLNPQWGFDEWVSDRRGTLHLGDQNYDYMGYTFYTFDVTQPQSLKPAFRAWNETLMFYPQGRMYIILWSQDYDAFQTGSALGEPAPCILTVYDADGVHQESVGDECPIIALDYYTNVLGIRGANGHRYFYLVKKDGEETTHLYAYNLAERTNTRLFTSEISGILGTSPDERYVILTLGERQGESCSRCDVYSGIGLAILDLTQNAIVYYADNAGIFGQEQIIWLDNRTFVYQTYGTGYGFVTDEQGEITPVRIPGYIRRVELGENGQYREYTDTAVVERGEFNAEYTYPRNEFWLTKRGLLDLRSMAFMPILRETLPDGFSARLNWRDDETILIHVSRGNDLNTEWTYQLALADVLGR